MIITAGHALGQMKNFDKRQCSFEQNILQNSKINGPFNIVFNQTVLKYNNKESFE